MTVQGIYKCNLYVTQHHTHLCVSPTFADETMQALHSPHATGTSSRPSSHTHPLCHPTPDPTLVVLQRFFSMPGSVVMLEATLRDEHRPGTAALIFDALSAIPTALLQPSRTDHPDSIPACVSLVATTRKLLCTLVHQQLLGGLAQRGDNAASSGFNSHDVAEEWPQEESPDAHETVGDMIIRRLTVLMTSMQQSVITLEALKLKLKPQPAANLPHRHQHSCQGVPTTSPCKKHQLHRLQTGLLLALQQGSTLLSASCGADVSTRTPDQAVSLQWYGEGPSCIGLRPKWLRELVGGLGNLSQGLSEVASLNQQGSPCQGTTRTSHVHPLWERYAVTHFHGRLVPGCCNLSCSNLGGVSEAALKTQLCSGCKRTRYCCVGCQRAAWVEGGHSTVCGK